MAIHVFECPYGHAIPDISGEPITGHIGYEVRIYCENCEEDIDGKYIGQSNQGINTIKNMRAEEVELVTRDNEPYCMKCDGECEVDN